MGDKKDREVQELLRKEASMRASIKGMDLGKIVRDSAGLEWWFDAETRWWWWLSEDGTWQSKSRSWTRGPLHQKNGTKRGMMRRSDDSDVASVKSAASSVSTALELPRRPCAWDKPLAIAADAPALVPDPEASAPASPTAKLLSDAVPSVALAEAEVSTKPEGQSLSRMVATISGEFELDESLTMAQVIAEANLQIGMTAEGNLAEQA